MAAIRGHSRLHLTLIDLGRATRRKYGGVGFTLESPATSVIVRSGRALSFDWPDSLEVRTRVEAQVALGRLAEKVGSLTLGFSVADHIPEHVGLGSKTALILGMLAAARATIPSRPSDDDLKKLSGRGGTSGVGVHGFFSGGCIVDCGQEAGSEDDELIPSGASVPDSVSLLGSRHEIPEHWRFHILIPPGIQRTIGQEIAFFEAETPIPKREVLETLALVYHGIVPSVINADLELLAESLAEVHRIGFKRRELDGQSGKVRDLYEELRQMNLGPTGMSSLGPTIYVITEPGGRSDQEVPRIVERIPGCRHFVTRGCNTGFDLL